MKSAVIAWMIRLLTGARQCPDPGGTHPRRIYYANHSSHLDSLVIWACLPPCLRTKARPVAAADYWSKTTLHRWLSIKVFRAVLIPRQHLKRTDDPIGAMAAVLAHGDDLILFPEGTRSLDGSIGKFHSGIHALALEFPEAELVPVYLENLNRILPKGEFLMLPLMCSATFGAPCPGPTEAENRRNFLNRARTALMDLACPAQDQAPDSHET